MNKSISYSLVIFVYIVLTISLVFFFFFFNDTATTEIYTLSLHDALPIFERAAAIALRAVRDFLAIDGHDLEEVRLVLFTDSDLGVYERALTRTISGGRLEIGRAHV